ncbi:hydroxyproline O-galactosyltransferase GALT2-like [Phragmites australis]|uniref:hydroxyproline O-galactosyltransferase GALT2-like n=1 Tax=Phragmites australis TaxID=29695 RepID=UPI002D78F361|nr:hydroxyproline O-galactosyltransferase GALT2-like [Phragmites australis]
MRARGGQVIFLPCGLVAGSFITVVGTPRTVQEYMPQLARMHQWDSTVLVSQFMVELQGPRAFDAEDPPRILHLNPRLRGLEPAPRHRAQYLLQDAVGRRPTLRWVTTRGQRGCNERCTYFGDQQWPEGAERISFQMQAARFQFVHTRWTVDPTIPSSAICTSKVPTSS